MKFRFKIQQYQTDAVESVARVFRGQPYVDGVGYVRDLGAGVQLAMRIAPEDAVIDPADDTGYKNEALRLTDAELLSNIHAVQDENNIRRSAQLNRDLGLLNSYAGLIINGLIAGSSILLMRNYFKSISYTLAESARIDGASELRIFAGIFLPISLPGLATVFFMDFVSRWNSITIPAAILTDESMYTLPLKLKAMILSTNSVSGTAQIPENAIMAAIVITALPLLLIYVFAQKFLLSGLNLGATKE